MTEHNDRESGSPLPLTLCEALPDLRRPPASLAVRFKIQNTAETAAQIGPSSTRAERRITMNDVTDTRQPSSDGEVGQDGVPAVPVDESRLAMMQRIKRLSVADRIALLDRMCREQTRLATRARRVR